MIFLYSRTKDQDSVPVVFHQQPPGAIQQPAVRWGRGYTTGADPYGLSPPHPALEGALLSLEPGHEAAGVYLEPRSCNLVSNKTVSLLSFTNSRPELYSNHL